MATITLLSTVRSKKGLGPNSSRQSLTPSHFSWWTFCKMQIISTPSTIWFELILRKGSDSPVLIPSANASQKYGPPEPKTQSEPPNTQTSEIGQEQELFCWIIENDRFMLTGTNQYTHAWNADFMNDQVHDRQNVPSKQHCTNKPNRV